MKNKIPIILDTDLGSDIDDTWALGLLLKSPEVDLKLVVTDTDDTVYRAKIACKMLEELKRLDVAVGIGVRQKSDPNHKTCAAWVEDYDLRNFNGTLHGDGVDALIRLIMDSPVPVTLVSIAPMPNMLEALKREPKIVKNAHFVGMHGSVYKGYDGKSTPDAEWNVVRDAPACRAVFEAKWLSIKITPLDTCGIIRLKGDKYQKVLNSKDPITSVIIENYRLWRNVRDNFKVQSSVLFDTVAVTMAFSTDLLKMEKIRLKVTDDGFTRPDKKGSMIDVAVDWKDLGAFEDFLVERYTKKMEK